MSDPTALTRWRTAAIALAAALVLALSALGAVWATAVRGYDEASPEVGFARDMHAHHEQAVVMSLLVRERGTDPQVAQLARDILTGQAEEQGVMLGWLRSHDVPVSTNVEPMAWMGAAQGGSGVGSEGGTGGHGSHDMGGVSAPEATQAPGSADPGTAAGTAARTAMGMASDEELAELGRLSGAAADLRYVQLMQRHHRGAVQMATAFTELSDEEQLSALGEGALTTQARELRILADLEERLSAQVAAG